MDSFTVTLLISRVCSQPKQTAGGSEVREKYMGAKQLLNTSAIWAYSLQNGNVLLLHYKNRPDYLFTWKVITKRKKCWIDFSLLLFWPHSLGTKILFCFFKQDHHNWFQNLKRLLAHQTLELIKFPKHALKFGFERSYMVHDFRDNWYIERDTKHVFFQSPCFEEQLVWLQLLFTLQPQQLIYTWHYLHQKLHDVLNQTPTHASEIKMFQKPSMHPRRMPKKCYAVPSVSAWLWKLPYADGNKTPHTNCNFEQCIYRFSLPITFFYRSVWFEEITCFTKMSEK